MGKLSRHSQKPLTEFYGDEYGREIWGGFTVHHTPAHGSRLNQAEIETGLFPRQWVNGELPG